MSEQIKVCPSCETEQYFNAKMCTRCGWTIENIGLTEPMPEKTTDEMIKLLREYTSGYNEEIADRLKQLQDEVEGLKKAKDFALKSHRYIEDKLTIATEALNKILKAKWSFETNEIAEEALKEIEK